MFDCCVIGAGPAGSTTAYYLARQGFKVALVDKSVFPRDKVCGDIIGTEACKILGQMGLSSLPESFLQEDINEDWELHFDGGVCIREHVERSMREGRFRWVTIPRMKLDAALLELAQQAGAVIFENSSVRDVEVGETQVNIVASGVEGRSLQARLAVVATGCKSKFVPSGNGAPIGFAVRNYYDGPPGLPPTLHFAADLQPGGYEWLLPVSSTRYNAGVITTGVNAKFHHMRLDKRLVNSTLTKSLQPIGRLKGGWLNYNLAFNNAPVHAERMLWVGDAAGIVQPHHGEGISQAFLSGKVAAEVAAAALENDLLGADDLSIYTRTLRRRLSRILGFGRVVYEVMKYPRIFRSSCRLLVAGFRAVRDI